MSKRLWSMPTSHRDDAGAERLALAPDASTA